MYILNIDIVEFYFLTQIGSLDLLIKNLNLFIFIFINDVFALLSSFMISLSLLLCWCFCSLVYIWTVSFALFFLSWWNVYLCFLEFYLTYVILYFSNHARNKTIYWPISLLDDKISMHQPFSCCHKNNLKY